MKIARWVWLFFAALLILTAKINQVNAEVVVGDQIEIYAGLDAQQEQSAAYDSINKRFLVVWDDRSEGRTNVYAQLVNSDGSLYAGRITICETVDGQDAGGSKVVFDPLSQRFLVVWGKNYIRHPEEIRVTETHGQFVNTDGSLSGKNFGISPDPFEVGIYGLYPQGIAFDSTLNRFFVLINKGDPAPYQLYGQFVNPDSSLGDFFQITNFTSGYGAWYAKLGFDSNNRRFLVAFGMGDLNGQIDGILLNADGSPYGQEFIIAEPPGSLITSVTFDSLDNRFLATWTTAYAGSYIRGQLVNSDGSLYGGMFTIKDSANGGPSIFDSVNKKFLVIGTYGGATFGQLLNPDGSLSGSSFDIAPFPAPFVYVLAAGSQESGSLVTWSVDLDYGTNKDIVGRLIQLINSAPVLNPIGDKEVNSGELLTFEVSGYDLEEDPLSINSSDLPQGATLVDRGDGTALFSWTLPDSPGAQYNVNPKKIIENNISPAGQSQSLRKEYNVIFKISDGEFADEETMTITVKFKRFKAIPYSK